MINNQVDWVSRLTQRAQHPIFRVAAVGFSLFSSLAVYDFFAPLVTSVLWHWALVIMTGSFVALNYFTLRGWSHRLLQKRSAKSYAAVGLLCLVVEVICNLTHASDVFLRGAQAVQIREWLFWPTLVVLCSMPVFGLVLALIDVDLMAEKGAIVSPSMSAQPRGVNMGVPNRTSAAPPSPQAVYPPHPGPSSGQQKGNVLNGLQNWYQQKGAGSANNGNGAQQPQPPMQRVI